MEEIAFDRGSITAVPFLGEHGDLNVLTKSAYLLRVKNHSLLFAAESCSISPKMYEHIQREIGDVDALFIGMECDGAPVSWMLMGHCSHSASIVAKTNPASCGIKLRTSNCHGGSVSLAGRSMSMRWARSREAQSRDEV